MKLLGIEKDKFVTFFLGYLLSILSLTTSFDVFCKKIFAVDFRYDIMVVVGIYLGLLALVALVGGFKLTKSVLFFFIFFVGAAIITLIVEPRTASYILGDGGTFLLQYNTKFILYSFAAYAVTLSVEDTETFLNVFEKFSYVTIVLAMLCYYLALGMNINLQYMTFSYDILLHITFLALRCISKFSWSKFICSFTGLFVIFIAGCRGAVVCFMASMLIYVMTLKFKDPIKKIVFFVCAIALIMTVVLNFEAFINDVIKFLDTYDIQSRTVRLIASGEFFEDSGRSVIQKKLIQNFNIFGHGLYTDRVLAGSYAHHFLYELMYDFGIIAGPVIFISITWLIISAFFKAEPNDKLLICALLSTGFLKLFFSGSYLNQEPSLYVLLGLCVVIKQKSKKGRNLV